VTKTIQETRARQAARFVEPMQCLAVAKLPEGPDWEYEIKFDGYRALGVKSAGGVRLMSRNGNDFSARFPSVARSLSKLPDDSVLDGEIVALDETGRPSFNVLQNYNHADTPLQFYAFDLLHLFGKNLRDRPFDDRRELLRVRVMPRMQGEVLFSETLEATAAEIVAAVKMTRLSCHRFAANEVRLWLSVLAYNLGNLWRRLALPRGIGSWSLTSSQQRLVKTGGRLFKHARYYWLLLAESHLTRRLFSAMLGKIAGLPSPSG
jgi:hypothetical protein